jgi:hypothetical protein
MDFDVVIIALEEKAGQARFNEQTLRCPLATARKDAG